MDSQLEGDVSSYTSLLQQNSDVLLESYPLSSQLSTDQDGGSRQRRGNNFSVDEDKLLVSAWLNTSLDPIAGTDMKSGGFWINVENYFNEAKKQDGDQRSANSLSHWWSTIQHAVNKFCGCLSQIERMHRSDVSKEYEIQEARKMFQQLYKRPFRYDHCWDLLKFEQKWIGRSNNIGTTKRKASPHCPSNQEDHDFNDIDRPIGRKAAKEKRKSSKDGIKDSTVISNALSELKAEKKKAHEDRMLKYDTSVEQRAELVELQKGQFEIQKAQFKIQKAQLLETKEGNRIKNEKLQLDKNREDMKIMMKDISSMNSMQQEYFKFRQMEIQQRMKTTF